MYCPTSRTSGIRIPERRRWALCCREARLHHQEGLFLGQTVDGVRAGGMAGTPGEIVDRIGDYAKAGADCLYLQVLDLADLDHVGLLGAEVLPQVSKAA